MGSKDVTAGKAAVLNACRVVSITTVIARHVGSMSLWFLEKGLAISVNDGRMLVIFVGTVSVALWVKKYSWGKSDIN